MCSVARGSTNTGRFQEGRRRQAAEGGDVFVELPVGLLGNLADRLVEPQIGIFLRRARVDLVVNVGDVAHIGDVVGAIEVPQQPKQHVEHDHRPRIADVREVVDRRTADIHAHIRRIERLEHPLVARQRIVEFQVHRRIKVRASTLLAGRVQNLDVEKRRPQPAFSLANNLPANAADRVKAAVHGRTMGEDGHHVKGSALA